MRAESRVRTLWEIEGRGPFVIGTIIDGTITAGMVASRVDHPGRGTMITGRGRLNACCLCADR